MEEVFCLIAAVVAIFDHSGSVRELTAAEISTAEISGA